jgi:DNA-binding NarL/FixJ family response regulator
MIRVLLVEDHASFRQPLACLLRREQDIAIVGQAGSLAGVRQALEGIDVAIVDLGLPDGSGVELVQELRTVNPHGAVLVLTARGLSGPRSPGSGWVCTFRGGCARRTAVT